MKNILFTVLLLVSLESHATKYYISATGSDANSGLTSLLPKQTITAVNALTLTAGDTVAFKKGDGWYGTLIAAYSGSVGSPIVYTTYGTGATPTITGFTTITSGWTNEGGGIYSKVITAESQTNMVTIDGVQYGMGRYPNSTFLTYESASGYVSITDNELTGTPNWTGAEAVIYKNDYRIERDLITNHTTNTLTYTIVSGSNMSASAPNKYFIQNDLKTLDQYGEWYHDYAGTGKFYMYFGVVDPTSKTVKVSTLNNLIKVNSAKTYITIDGLSLTGSIKQAILADSNCHNVTVQNSSISFAGSDGAYIDGQYATINNSTFNYCNRISIMTVGVNATISNNTILNNSIIIGQGNYGWSGTSAIVAARDNATVIGNNIQNTGTNGIFVSSDVLTGLVKNNYIYNTCVWNDDHGSIYCYGLRSAFVIESNVIDTSDGSGIYLDATSSNIEVKNNLVASCAVNGIFIHRSHDIIVTGNTVFDCGLTQLMLQNYINEDLMYNITATNNIFVAKSASQKTLWYQTIYTGYASRWNTFSFSGNIYARPISDATTIYAMALGIGGNKTLAEWKTLSGTDTDAVGSPVSIVSESDAQFMYNETASPKNTALSWPAVDMEGVKKVGIVAIPAYSSYIFLKDPNPAPAPSQGVKRPGMSGGKAGMVGNRPGLI
jgi:parallel beta-helix repeat protein